MKKLVLLFLIGITIAAIGCSKKTLPGVNSVTEIKERLVPVPVPADSSALKALFACDSLNNVYLKALSENKGNNVQSSFDFKNGQLTYKTKYVHDTLYAKAKDSIQKKEIPVPYPVEVEKDLTGFQNFLIWSGSILWLLTLIVIAVKLFTGRIPFIK